MGSEPGAGDKKLHECQPEDKLAVMGAVKSKFAAPRQIGYF
jgi:hypothetical protein